jgi:cysteine-rich repeat protein
MRLTLSIILAITATLAASGCLIVTRDKINSFDEDSGPRDDGSPDDRDSGGPLFDDTCGNPTPMMMLRDGRLNIAVDTTSYRGDVGMSCEVSTPGNDIFLGVDVAAGQVWHFHLTGSGDRQPMLYLSDGSCDPRECSFQSAFCDTGGDEHFAFIPDAPGLWYVGIDDSAPGGGVYDLDVYVPICGDNESIHGEACDDGGRVAGDGCDEKCRVELSEARTNEEPEEPNDNIVEANSILMPASNVLEITGSISSGGGCRYPDIFAIDVPAMGDLSIDALNSDSTACASGALTPFEFSLERANGDVVVATMADSNGCSIVRAPNLNEGEYFLRVFLPPDVEASTNYRLRIRIQP